MKRKSLLFALLVALLLVMLPLQAMAAQGEGVTPEDGDISIEIPSTPSTPAVYTVVFKDADGTVLSMQNYKYGDAVVAPEAPVKAADETYTYEFAGWNKEVTACVGNAVYTATYTQSYIDYTVEFISEGDVISTATYHYGDTVAVPADPAKAGNETYTYTFAGWDKEVAAVTGNATYIATFTEAYVEYTVKFVSEGTVISTQTYHYGDTVAVPEAPAKAEDDKYTYEFAGWDMEVVAVNGNATYTAQFNAVEKAPAAENAIVKQPESITVDSGETVQFSVVATGDVVSYKWEYRKLYKWFNTSMTGYNTDTLTVGATGQRNNYGYRCTVTFADGTVIVSEEAKLTVKTYMNVTYHPNDQIVVLGYKGQFTAAAEGEGIKYQWQYCRPGSDLWIDTAMEGATKATVMIETTTARDGYRYRCKITDVTGNETFTEVATMRVLAFNTHPVETFAATGATVQFTVEANQTEGFSYQWQYRRSATGTWTNTTLTGYNTNTLSVPAKGKNGYEYRCVLTGSKNSQIASKGAVLHVGDPVVISAQPADVTCAVGEVASFTVEATNAYSYQWQYCRPGSTTWQNTGADGNQTATVNVTVKSNNNGYQYRCVIKGLDGAEYISDVASLTLG